MPPMTLVPIGTPITGRMVCAASTPPRCAALPAAAMITPKPSAAAFFASCSATAGVRCAEQMRTSVGMSNDFKRSMHFSITLRSLSEPMMTSTFFICFASSK